MNQRVNLSTTYPCITYCNSTWSSTYASTLSRIYYLQKRAVRAITNSEYRAHTAPLFSKLEILDIFQVKTLDTAKFMYICCLHFSAICLWQTVKSIDMRKEQLVIIECIPVVRTSRNSQFFTKDLESGTVSCI